jgi:hypothetical protein
MQFKKFALVVAAASGCLLTPLPATPPALASGWLPAVSVATGPIGVRAIDVASDSAGTTIVAWADAAGTLRVRIRPAGGSLGPESTLSNQGATVGYDSVDLAMNDRGDAVLAWAESNSAGNGLVPRAAWRPAGGSFESARTLAGGSVNTVHAAIGGNGAAAVTWLAFHDPRKVVEASSRPAGATAFGAASALSADYANASEPDVAMDEQGRALLVWGEAFTGLHAAAGSPAGAGFGWEYKGSLSDVVPRELGMAADGQATILSGGTSVINATTRSPGGLWGETRQVTTEAVTQWALPVLAVGRTNHAAAVWGWTTGELDAPRQPRAAIRAPFEAFGSTQTLSTDTKADTLAWDITVDNAGNTTAVWGQDGLVQAARAVGAGRFGPPDDLARAPGAAMDVNAAADGAGNAVAVWLSRAFGRHDSVQIAAYDASAPEIRGFTAGTQATAGDAAAFEVATFDRWSPVTVTWSFGDGQTAIGAATDHVYAAAGTYEVAATARDAAGNSVTQRRTIAVVARPAAPTEPTGGVSATTAPEAPVAASGSGGSSAPPAQPARRLVSPRFDYLAEWSRKSTRFTAFTVTGVRAGSTLRLTCRGKGCPRRNYVKRFTRDTARVVLLPHLRASRLRPGAVLELIATAPNSTGTVQRFVIRRDARPRVTALCLPPNAGRPTAC